MSADAQAAAGGFIRIRRADAAPGGTDTALASLRFESLVERLVGGRDQVGGIGNAQPFRRDGNPGLAKHVHFFEESGWVDHHAVSQDGNNLRVNDPGWNKMQFKDPASQP